MLTPGDSATASGSPSASASAAATAPSQAPASLPQGRASSVTVRIPPAFALERVLSGQDGPVAVAFDAAGVPFVAEEGGGGRILRLTPNGGSETVAAGGFPLPLGGLVAGRGVLDLAASGAVLQLPEGGGARKALVVGLRGPLTGLAAGPDGRLYVGVTGTGHVAALPWAGGPPLVAATGLHAPTGLAFGPEGSLYVADDTSTGDVVLRLHPGADPAPAAQKVAQLPAGAVAAGIAVPPPGPFRSGQDIYVAVDGGIDVVNPLTGAVRPFLTTVGTDGPRRPAGIAFSPDGRSLYIADLGETFATVPLPTTGAIWRVVAVDGPPGSTALAPAPGTASASSAAAPAIQVTPAPGPQNKVRPVGPPRPWYRQPHVVMAGVGVLALVAILLLVQFRRARL